MNDENDERDNLAGFLMRGRLCCCFMQTSPLALSVEVSGGESDKEESLPSSMSCSRKVGAGEPMVPPEDGKILLFFAMLTILRDEETCTR